MSDIPASSSSPSDLIPLRHIEATINYSEQSPTSPPDEKWYTSIHGTIKRNYDIAPTPLKVYDMRGQESATHIDTTGFQAITSPSSVSSDFMLTSSDDEIRKVYYPEVEALLLKQTGASRVVFFDHTIRRPLPDHIPETPATRRPVLRAHVDQTPASAHRRVERHVQPPHPYKRFQLINVWRPILNKVYDYPLAVCDARSLDVVNDLVPTTLIYAAPNPNGETYSVTYNDKHKWWFWSEMTPNDVMLLKCYDSASRALTHVKTSTADVQESELRDVAGMTPHTAFLDKEGAKKDVGRHSIEVRALVFYD
jgi:cephamycin C biosynthesis protein